MIHIPTKNNGKAFSLIELLITLALVAIVITFTIPRTTFFTRFLVQAEISKLQAIFTYLQERAIASNEDQELRINTSNNSYQFKTIQGKTTIQTLPSPISFGFLPGIKGPPSHPDQPVTAPATFPLKNGASTITFMTNGKISPGSLYITDKKKQYQGALTCPISQVSYIRKYSYDNQQWSSW